MKKYSSIAIALLAIFAFNSCSLDEYNPSAISTDEEWSTAAGYEKLVNGCYFDLVRIVYGQAEDTYVIESEGGTDIWQAAPSASANWRYAQTYEQYGPNVSMFFEAYCGFYATVNQCNAAIMYADKVTGLSEEKVKQLKAEAQFLRAHCLFNIVEYYGGKYLPTTPTSGPITSLPTASVNEFYDVILADLKDAMANLPMKTSSIVPGHVTRAAAYHLYAKACMTYATYTDGKCGATPITETQKNELLTESLNASEYLINNAASFGVKFYPSIEQVFDEKNNKNNEEALFVVTHSTVTSLNPRGNYFNRVWKHFGCYTNNSSYLYLEGITPDYNTTPKLAKCNGYICPSKKFLDLFGEKDLRYNAFFTDTYYVNKANNSGKYRWTAADAKRYGLNESRVNNPDYDLNMGEKAIYLSRTAVSQADKDAAKYAIYNIEDNYKNPAAPGGFYPSLKKQDCPSLYAGTNASKPYSAADCIVYRLGETYLLAAEAAWRQGNNGKAIQYINAIRNRACEGHDGSMNLSGTVSQDQLLDEYALEMCGEWVRWQTLKRFRAFESRLKAFNPQNADNWKDLYYVRPVNTAEILTLTNPEEYQTEGF